ncbi:hypothetical protein DITRI_Ditri17bG0038100 [Diplodiscus trichospermus]
MKFLYFIFYIFTGITTPELGCDYVCDTINCEKIFQIQAGRLLSRTEFIYLKLIHQFQGPIQVASLRYLRKLTVSKCNRLKSLFSAMLARNLPQLKLLHIECCEELEEIIEMDQTSIASSSEGHLQPISFHSLGDLRIYGCSNLKSLFAISIARSLSNLKSIKICRASKLEQVFGYQGEINVKDDKKELVLPALKELKLSELPSLKSFARKDYNFGFPSLDSFEITECPKLTTSYSSMTKLPAHAKTKVSTKFSFYFSSSLVLRKRKF